MSYSFSTYLVKFAHEREFRTDYFSPKIQEDLDVPPDDSDPRLIDEFIAGAGASNFEPRVLFPFDLNLISGILLDPRAEDWFVDSISHICEQILELKNIEVRKSDLYDSPEAETADFQSRYGITY